MEDVEGLHLLKHDPPRDGGLKHLASLHHAHLIAAQIGLHL
jgi:hypothetical protein